jgi:CheY-like chemotaxis protein
MPEEDGWSLLSRLKADPELADIPVIMLTVVDERNRGFALGAADYMTKPIDRGRLAAVLQKVKNGGARTILVVDDDDDLRSMLHRMLAREGWEVAEADNGLTALRRVAEKRPGLILLDLMMPELDGFGFLRELRRTEEWRSIPVVVLTALDLGDEERKQLNGCVERILQKGAFSLDELEREVRSLVRSSLRGTTAPSARPG